MFPPFVPQVVPDGMEFVFAVREAMSHGISMGKPMENTGESRKKLRFIAEKNMYIKKKHQRLGLKIIVFSNRRSQF